MESTERLVRTWMATGRDDEVQQTVAGRGIPKDLGRLQTNNANQIYRLERHPFWMSLKHLGSTCRLRTTAYE